jgi:hypothetical protein
VFAAATFTWLGDVLGYLWVQKTNGHGDIPGLNTSYMGSVVLELEEKDNLFKMNFLIAVVAASFWFKVFTML